MDVYELLNAAQSLDRPQRSERHTSETGPGQARMRPEAASLNHRDLSILRGRYPGTSDGDLLISLSDGACDVDAVDEGVTAFEPGDRVAGLVSLPDHRSFQEGSTVPRAGITAWHSPRRGRVAVADGENHPYTRYR